MKMRGSDLEPGRFRRPGRVFPLVAKRGGVLVRNGHRGYSRLAETRDSRSAVCAKSWTMTAR